MAQKFKTALYSKFPALKKRFIISHPLEILTVTAPFLAGLFFEWMSCLVSLYLLGYLFFHYRRYGFLTIQKSLTFVATVVLSTAYALTALWGVDHGMSLLGFAKFLPLPLFALSLSQTELEIRRNILRILPVSGAVMTVLSFVASLIPMSRPLFLFNGRLGGFFQYPNVFALYLLLGIVVLITSKYWRIRDIVVLCILLMGVFLSGSRTVIVLLVVIGLTSMFFVKNRRIKLTLVVTIASLLIATGVYALISDSMATVGRYLTTSLNSSTFLGRLLYFKDALPVVLTHPFGMGYLGYSFMQGSFQTGVYYVQNIHNELLQCMLDIGWIPTLLVLIALIQSFRRVDIRCKIILLIAFAHCLFDFDLQFIAMDLILLTAMDIQGTGAWVLKRNKKKNVCNVVCIMCIVLSVFCLYFGVPSVLYYAGEYSACIAINPLYTNAWIQLLPEQKDAAGMDKTADHVLMLNSSVPLAYDAKARAAYADGDFTYVITYKNKAISLARYSLSEYLDYFDMLYVGIQLYEQAEDYASAEYCRERLLEIPDMLDRVLQGTSDLAWKIKDKPELTLPEEYMSILKQEADK